MNLDSFIESEELNDKEVKKVKEYIESLKKSKEKQGNEECPYWKRGCNDQICPMLNSHPEISDKQIEKKKIQVHSSF